MQSLKTVSLCLAFLCPTLALRAGEEWPVFRGATQHGIAEGVRLPVRISEGEHVKWKVEVPGEGWSSPVVWGEQIWLTTATEEGRSRRAICYDKSSGKLVHDVEVFAVPSEAVEPKNRFNSYSSPTPVIEEGRVYVSWGTQGSAAIDTKTGKVLWRNTELKLDHKEGPGSSPILYKNLFILNCDGMDVQYVVALDKETGKVVWKTPRSAELTKRVPDLRKAFTTPMVIEVGGRKQLVSIGAFRVYAYEPETGRELWYCDHAGFSGSQAPMFVDGLVIFSTGYMRPEMVAVRPDGKGDVSKTHVAWVQKRTVPIKPGLVPIDGALYGVTDNGMGVCFEVASGKALWTERLGGSFSASPVYAGGHLYFLSDQSNEVFVVRPDRGKLEVVAATTLGEKAERFMASPAVSGGAMYVRSTKRLYRVEGK